MLASSVALIGLPAQAAAPTTNAAVTQTNMNLQNDSLSKANRAGARKRWSSKKITYSDHTGRPDLVRNAVRAWNGATKGVRLVKRKKGQIRIFAKKCPTLNTACAYGPGDGRVYMGAHWKRPESGYEPFSQELVIHEIGHALGLNHVGWSCSIMQPYMNDWERACRETRPRPGDYEYGACPPQRADAKRLARLYGTKPKTSGWCRFGPVAPPTPTYVVDGW